MYTQRNNSEANVDERVKLLLLRLIFSLNWNVSPNFNRTQQYEIL
jgi:hypothetical protein